MVTPALVRDTLSLPRAHAYFLLLCVFVLVVGLVGVACYCCGRLAAIEGRAHALPTELFINVRVEMGGGASIERVESSWRSLLPS